MSLILGTWQLSGDSYGPIPLERAFEILRKFECSGGLLVETSNSYGLQSQSERVLSRYFELHKESRLRVITKVGNLPHIGRSMPQKWDYEFITEQASKAIERFHDRLYGLLLHSPPVEDRSVDIALSALSALCRGLRLKIGVALRTTSDLRYDSLNHTLIQYGTDILTINFSLLDQRALLYSQRLSELAGRLGTRVFARTVLNFGFLGNPELQLLEFFDHRNSWSDNQIALWRKGSRIFSQLAFENQLKPVELAVRFAASFPFISDICIGFLSGHELVEVQSGINMGPLNTSLLDKCIDIYQRNTFFAH